MSITVDQGTGVLTGSLLVGLFGLPQLALLSCVVALAAALLCNVVQRFRENPAVASA